MLAADDEGIIYRINSDTGATTALGASGVAGIRSMAYSAAQSRFFVGTDASVIMYVGATMLSPTVFTLDTSSGAETGGSFTGMSTDPSSGIVYAVNESECSTIFSFDPQSGVAQPAAIDAVPECYSLNAGGIPIAVNATGTFYLVRTYSSTKDVYTLNLVEDTSQLFGTYTYSGFPVPGSEGIVNDMAIRPSDQRIYVTTTAGYLGVLNVSNAPTLVVDYLATLPKTLDGLTFATGVWPDVSALPTALLTAGSTGKVYRIDTGTGAATLLGNTGVADIGSLAYVWQSGKLFAGTSGTVYTIASGSLSATEFTVTPQGGAPTGGWHSGMAPDFSSGLVYTVNESECSAIFTLDPQTGNAVLAVDNGVPECYSNNAGGIPIGRDHLGNFYLVRTYSSGKDVYTVDVPGDSSTLLGSYTYSGFPAPGSEGIVNDMAIRPGDKKIFVTTTAGYVGILDISAAPSLTVTYLATLPEVTDGLTFAAGAWAGP
jgi:hypothetical protein